MTIEPELTKTISVEVYLTHASGNASPRDYLFPGNSWEIKLQRRDTVREISIADAFANGSFGRDKIKGTAPVRSVQMEVAPMASCLTVP